MKNGINELKSTKNNDTGITGTANIALHIAIVMYGRKRRSR